MGKSVFFQVFIRLHQIHFDEDEAIPRIIKVEEENVELKVTVSQMKGNTSKVHRE